MKVSIGMPVYNGEQYLADSLDSILKQTYSDFELIICDNASTDNTEKICRDYMKLDRRIRYFRNPVNIGAAKNYNNVFQISIGEYFRWANHDDLFAPESLARCVEVLDNRADVVLVYPRTKIINYMGDIVCNYNDDLDLQTEVVSDRFAKAWQRVRMINVIYGLIRRKIIEKTTLMNDFFGADVSFVAELSLYGKFFEIPDYLFFRRVHKDAFSSKKDLKEKWQFYRPDKLKRIHMTECKYLLEGFKSIMRFPGKKDVKSDLYKNYFKVVWWSRSYILKNFLNEIFALCHVDYKL